MESRFLLFKASAGSGKTFNLAAQYIALLVANDVHEYRHTLAVTFTNKATAEMKDRILIFLQAIWQGTEKGKKPLTLVRKILDEQYGLHPSEQEIREKCRQALLAILHDYSRFMVSTIDAFFQMVLRSMAHELGLNARLQVDIEDRDVIELAVENVIENAGHKDSAILPYLRQYIEEQLDENKSWDVRRELKRMAGMLFQEAYLRRSMDEDCKEFNTGNISSFRKLLNAERRAAIIPPKEAAGKFDEILSSTGMTYDTMFSYSGDVLRYVSSIKAGNLDAKFGKRLSDMSADGQKLLQSKLRGKSYDAVASQLADQLAEIGRKQEIAATRVLNIDLVLANLLPMGLLGAIDSEITRITNERNRFMLARTPIMLKRMIGKDDASFVFERIGTQFHNIMIDEFQDTSRLQWENFRTLLIDNLASGGMSMVVGDIKQSIYRWRSGDWHILDDLGRKGYNGIPLTHNPLRDNHRSLGRIVDFNNRLFPLAAEKLDAISTSGEKNLSLLYDRDEVRQEIVNDAEAGFVRINLCHTTDRNVSNQWTELMLDDVCTQVKDLYERGVPYNKMTILLRKNKYIEPTINHFAKRMPDVKLVSNEAFLLGASVAVRMIVSALQVVEDHKYWQGNSNEPVHDPVAMAYLKIHYQRDVLHKVITEGECCLMNHEEALPAEFISQLSILRHLPLYELCETSYRILQLNEIEKQDAFTLTFFDELSVYLHDNPSDIPTFLQYWEDTMQNKPIPSGEVDGIRIFTIHKSKGLAFHTVLMPFAEWTFEKDRSDDLYWCASKDAPLNEIGSVPVRFTAQTRKSSFGNDYLKEHDSRRADELNALYVAFTRPEANLYVWGLSHEDISPDNFNTTTADLLHACLPEMEGLKREAKDDDETFETYTYGSSPATVKEKMKQESDETEVKMQSFEGNLSFRQSNQATDFVRQAGEEKAKGPDEQQLGYIERGKLLHYIFSKIERAEDIERVVRQFAQNGILKSDKQVKQVCDLARRGLRHGQVRDWFSGRYELFNECNILIPDEKTGKLEKRRPDRVMMSEDRIIIVDFKFGKPDVNYKGQVAKYMEILQSMYPSHKVEGWLWYVYKNVVEEVRDI